MAKLDKVVKLNYRDVTNVSGVIMTFLNRKAQNSPITKDRYHRAIRDFFLTMRNKEISQLVEDDLIFTKEQIEQYQVMLKNQYRGSTVNGVMTAMRECYKRLYDAKFPVDVSWFDVERYDQHDTESFDTLTHDEVYQIMELISKTRKGSEKALLIRLAYATAWRKTALLELTWDDIFEHEGFHYIMTVGKYNKKSQKKLSNSLYQSLMDFKKDSLDTDKIFQLTDKTVSRMMKYIRDNMDFGKRRIVFHSIKKASVDEVNKITGGDIKAMQSHADHSDAKTTLNIYTKNKDLDDLTIVDLNLKLPTERFEDLSKEELVNLMMEMDRSTKMKLLQKIDKLYGTKTEDL